MQYICRATRQNQELYFGYIQVRWHVQATFDVMWEGSTCTEYSPLRLSKESMQFNQNGESTFSPFSPRRSREQTAITKCFEHAQSATQTLTDCMPISRTQDNKEQKSSLSCSFFFLLKHVSSVEDGSSAQNDASWHLSIPCSQSEDDNLEITHFMTRFTWDTNLLLSCYKQMLDGPKRWNSIMWVHYSIVHCWFEVEALCAVHTEKLKISLFLDE